MNQKKVQTHLYLAKGVINEMLLMVQLVDRISERNLQILQYLWIDEKSVAQTAEAFGLSVQRIEHIRSEYKRRLPNLAQRIRKEFARTRDYDALTQKCYGLKKAFDNHQRRQNPSKEPITEVLAKPIEQCGLDLGLVKRLPHHVEIVSDVLDYTEEQLLQGHAFGQKKLEVVKDFLAKYGLCLSK